MNVVFLEPAFPANQRAFVLALAEVGATVIGIGERPVDWLDDELKAAMAHYEQVHSVVDEGALLHAVREIQGAVWVDRLEATVEAHIMAAAHVREACTIPGTASRTAYLCRDKPAMKEVLRAAGVACAAVDRCLVGRRGAGVRRRRRLPRDPQAARRRRRVGTHRADDRRAAGGCDPCHRRRPRRGDRGRGVHRGPRGLLRHDHDRRPGRARVRLPLLPERARGDAHALDLAAVHRHQPRRRGRLRRGQSDRPQGHRGARHRHLGDAHGVVLRAEGTEVLRDRLPAAGRARVGPLRRRQRHGPLPRVGDGGRARPAVAAALAPLRRRHHRAAPRPRRPHRRLRRARRDAAAVRRVDHRRPPPAGRARRPSRSRPATWRTRGCG